jgi:hypothetical protein
MCLYTYAQDENGDLVTRTKKIACDFYECYRESYRQLLHLPNIEWEGYAKDREPPSIKGL